MGLSSTREAKYQSGQPRQETALLAPFPGWETELGGKGRTKEIHPRVCQSPGKAQGNDLRNWLHHSTAESFPAGRLTLSFQPDFKQSTPINNPDGQEMSFHHPPTADRQRPPAWELCRMAGSVKFQSGLLKSNKTGHKKKKQKNRHVDSRRGSFLPTTCCNQPWLKLFRVRPTPTPHPRLKLPRP